MTLIIEQDDGRELQMRVTRSEDGHMWVMCRCGYVVSAVGARVPQAWYRLHQHTRRCEQRARPA